MYDTNANGAAAMSVTETQVRARLNDPQTAETMLVILDKLDVIALMLTSIDGFLRRGDVLADNVAESIRDVRSHFPEPKVNTRQVTADLVAALPVLAETLPRLTADLPALVELADRLNQPQTREAMHTLIDQLPLLALATTATSDFLSRGEELTDNLAEGLQTLRTGMAEAGVDVAATAALLTETLPQLAQSLPTLAETLPRLVKLLPAITEMTPQLLLVVERLRTLFDSPEFTGLIESGVFAPDTVDVVGKAGTALVHSVDELRRKPQRLGTWGLFRSLSDPDVQSAAGLLVEFARQFGRQVQNGRDR